MDGLCFVSLEFYSLFLLRINTTPCWLKHLCFIRAFVPMSFSLSLSLSLSGYFFGVHRISGFTFLPCLLRPSQEGSLCFHRIKRAPEAFVNRASPVSGTLLVFCINQGISASFSLLYFLIIDSGPPGSGPLKELNTFTVSSFRIWKSSTGISSPPLAVFLVMLPKAHLTSHSRL